MVSRSVEFNFVDRFLIHVMAPKLFSLEHNISVFLDNKNNSSTNKEYEKSVHKDDFYLPDNPETKSNPFTPKYERKHPFLERLYKIMKYKTFVPNIASTFTAIVLKQFLS